MRFKEKLAKKKKKVGEQRTTQWKRKCNVKGAVARGPHPSHLHPRATPTDGTSTPKQRGAPSAEERRPDAAAYAPIDLDRRPGPSKASG